MNINEYLLSLQVFGKISTPSEKIIIILTFSNTICHLASVFLDFLYTYIYILIYILILLCIWYIIFHRIECSKNILPHTIISFKFYSNETTHVLHQESQRHKTLLIGKVLFLMTSFIWTNELQNLANSKDAIIWIKCHWSLSVLHFTSQTPLPLYQIHVEKVFHIFNNLYSFQ